MRKLITAVILLVGVMFILSRFAEIENITTTFQQGDWRFLGLAALVELLWIVNIGTSLKAVYRLLGIEEKLLHMITLAIAANFVNIVAPSAGLGGVAVFVASAQKRGYSGGHATVASTLYVLFDYLGFITILALGFVVLIRRDQVTPPAIMASIIIVLIAAALTTLLYLGARSEKKLAAVLVWLTSLINALVRPFRPRKSAEYLSANRARSFAAEIADGILTIKRHPRDLLYPFLLAVNSKVLLILVLTFVFLTFKVPVSIGTLVAGFSVAYLFMIVSPTPSGVGIVEGLLTLALRSFYLPLGTAAIIALVYRGFTFWLPFFVGLIAFRWVGSNGANPDSKTI